MKIVPLMTDETVLAELGRRLTDLRLQANLTQAQLALEAGVPKRTVERTEAGQSPVALTAFLRIARALRILDRLDEFIPEPGPTPMDLLERGGRRRQRASGRGSRPNRVGGATPAEPWTWGDDHSKGAT